MGADRLEPAARPGFRVLVPPFRSALLAACPGSACAGLLLARRVIVGLILVNRSFGASMLTALRQQNRTLAGVLAAVAAILSLSLLWPFASKLFALRASARRRPRPDARCGSHGAGRPRTPEAGAAPTTAIPTIFFWTLDCVPKKESRMAGDADELSRPNPGLGHRVSGLDRRKPWRSPCRCLLPARCTWRCPGISFPARLPMFPASSRARPNTADWPEVGRRRPGTVSTTPTVSGIENSALRCW